MTALSPRRRALLDALAPFAGLAVILVAIAVYGALARPDASFFTGYRMALIAKQSAILGVGAIGMTAVIAAGGIDLSIGAILALCSVVLAKCLEAGVGAAPALAITLATGTLAGALNGVWITRLRLMAFIVTLGSMLAYRGIAEAISDQRKIAAVAPAWLGGLLDPPSSALALGLPGGVWLCLAMAAILAVVLARSVFGRQVFAIGSSEATARLCGVPVERRKIEVYALCGLCMAVAGVLEFDNLNGQGNPSSGLGVELDVIAAVVIGGGSLSGGRGSVLGSLVGAWMITTLAAGCAFAQMAEPIQNVVTGAIIVIAVALDRTRATR